MRYGQSLDDNVGRVLDKLDELKLSKNTLIFSIPTMVNMYNQVDGTKTSNRPHAGEKETTGMGAYGFRALPFGPDISKKDPNRKNW